MQDKVAAIHAASFAGHTEVVNSLMLAKADVNLQDEVSVSTIIKPSYNTASVHVQ